MAELWMGHWPRIYKRKILDQCLLVVAKAGFISFWTVGKCGRTKILNKLFILLVNNIENLYLMWLRPAQLDFAGYRLSLGYHLATDSYIWARFINIPSQDILIAAAKLTFLSSKTSHFSKVKCMVVICKLCKFMLEVYENISGFFEEFKPSELLTF